VSNVVWGLINAVAAVVLLDYAPVTVGIDPSFISASAGALLGGSFVANHFNRVRNESNHPGNPGDSH